MTAELVPHHGAASLPDMVRYAEHLANANLLPRQYQRQPANVLYAMEYGRTLGITPLAAITGIHVIEGKPSASAALISGLVRQAGHRLRVRGDDKQAWAQIIRSDDPDYDGYQVTWTLDRARQAGLANKDVWKKYPAAMLKARAITEVARDACEEVLFGLHYTPEELGANVDAEGEPVAAPVQQLRRVPGGEPDQWATPEPVQDFVAEAQQCTDADCAVQVFRRAEAAGADASVLEEIKAIGRKLREVGQPPLAGDVVDAVVVEDVELPVDDHAAAVAAFYALAAENGISDTDADKQAYVALGAPLADVAPKAIWDLLSQLTNAA